jgi:hypothetical protein
MNFDHPEAAIAYRVDYVDRDGRAYVTARQTVEAARALVAEIAADGGQVIRKRIERGNEAASLLRAVSETRVASSETF